MITLSNKDYATIKHFALIEEILAYLRTQSAYAVTKFSDALYKAESNATFNANLDDWLSTISSLDSVKTFDLFRDFNAPDLSDFHVTTQIDNATLHIWNVNKGFKKSLTNFDR